MNTPKMWKHRTSKLSSRAKLPTCSKTWKLMHPRS